MCEECINHEFILNEDFEKITKAHCMNFAPIDNCIRYDVTDELIGSSLYCAECTESTFLNE